ncbi:KilA-N domain-containing protein [Stenotrophomonas maltophilia]|uniref:KilA-N domain-containing protein n=1 Tax=Stenotrophomonas lactitubi TaxID=2045214 RepID=UPI00203D0BEF|nr:KilA-N domain-containing protein [Stenotrophomonas lactitubi]MCO7472534.1 KilA-N domain-containing protein [Stenotrophomonas maltophilia]
MIVQTATASPLLMGNLQIRRDHAGRYCLNDLHQAAGLQQRHRPSRWAENAQTTELARIASIKAGIPALVSQRGGTAPSTYAVKPLVYAYAMWISPEFHLAVIAAYDALVTGQPQPAGQVSTSAALHTARARVVNRL